MMLEYPFVANLKSFKKLLYKICFDLLFIIDLGLIFCSPIDVFEAEVTQFGDPTVLRLSNKRKLFLGAGFLGGLGAHTNIDLCDFIRLFGSIC